LAGLEISAQLGGCRLEAARMARRCTSLRRRYESRWRGFRERWPARSASHHCQGQAWSDGHVILLEDRLEALAEAAARAVAASFQQSALGAGEQAVQPGTPCTPNPRRANHSGRSEGFCTLLCLPGVGLLCTRRLQGDPRPCRQKAASWRRPSAGAPRRRAGPAYPRSWRRPLRRNASHAYLS